MARSAAMKMQNAARKDYRLFAEEMFEGCKGIFGMVDDPSRFDILLGEQVAVAPLRCVQDVDTEPQSRVEITPSCLSAGPFRSKSRRNEFEPNILFNKIIKQEQKREVYTWLLNKCT